MLRMVLIICCSVMLMGCSATLEEWGWINSDFSTDYVGFKNDSQNCNVTSDQQPQLNYDRWTTHTGTMRRGSFATGNNRSRYRDKDLFTPYMPTFGNHRYQYGARDYYGANRDKGFNYCMLDKGWIYQQVTVN